MSGDHSADSRRHLRQLVDGYILLRERDVRQMRLVELETLEFRSREAGAEGHRPFTDFARRQDGNVDRNQ